MHNITREMNELYQQIRESICQCGYCGDCESDMIFHPYWKEWWCLERFKQEEERINPKDKFNEGVIVHKDAEKPYHILKWCPYGSLVESFRLRNMKSKYTCLVFDHDCPVFYVSEQFTESLCTPLSRNKKLRVNLKKCEGYNDKNIIAQNVEKPCHILNWCPYGSLDDDFFIRDLNYKYGCKIFPHDCPAFYHAEPLKEKN